MATLERGATSTGRTTWGTRRCFACQKGDADIARLLLIHTEQGVEQPQVYLLLAIIAAIPKSRASYSSADHMANNCGFLSFATSIGREVVRGLLRAGANVNHAHIDDLRPLTPP